MLIIKVVAILSDGEVKGTGGGCTASCLLG